MTRPTIASANVFKRQFHLPLPDAKDRAAILGVLLLVLFFLREAVFGGRVFYIRDIHLQWHGQMETFVRTVASGSLPLWDPFVSFGRPLLANANNQVLYPLTWLNLLMRPWTYYTVFLAFHLVLSAAGMLALGRRLGISPIGSFVAATLWTASGPLLSLGNLWNHLAAAAWVPWALLAADVACSSGRVSHALLWGATLAAQVLAGSPDVFAMTVPFTLSAGLRAVRWRDPAARSNRQLALSASIALAFAIALSAGQVLPSLELANQSERWRQSELTRTYWSVHPFALLQVIVPVPFDELPLQAEHRFRLFDGREPYLLSLYLGLPALALALAALSGPRRPYRSLLVVTGLISVLVALGKHAVFYDVIVGLLPPLKVLRYPAKAMVFAGFAVSALAGMGFDTLSAVRPEARRRFRIVVLCPVLLVAGAASLSAILVWQQAETWGSLFLVRFSPEVEFASILGPIAQRLGIVAGLGFLVVVLASLSRRGAAWARIAAAGVGVLALADLALAHKNLNPTAPKTLFTARPAAVEAVRQDDHRRLFVYDYVAAPGLSMRHLNRPIAYPNVHRDSPLLWAGVMAIRLCLLPPISEAWGIYESYARNHLGIQPRPIAELNAALLNAEGTPSYVRLLRLGAVSQVLTLHADGFEDLVAVTTLPGPYAEPLRVFEVPAAMPRSYVVSGVRVTERSAALGTLLDRDFDLEREIVLDTGETRPPSSSFSGTSRILELEADRVRLETEATESAYAVLVDTYDPGWRATVDGKEATVLRANTAFRAVEVSAGRHLVEFVYRPRAVTLGLAVSGAALLALGAALARLLA